MEGYRTMTGRITGNTLTSPPPPPQSFMNGNSLIFVSMSGARHDLPMNRLRNAKLLADVIANSHEKRVIMGQQAVQSSPVR